MGIGWKKQCARFAHCWFRISGPSRLTCKKYSSYGILWFFDQEKPCPSHQNGANTIDYSLKRGAARTCYVETGHLPIDNNLVENSIRSIALGKMNWLKAKLWRSPLNNGRINLSIINEWNERKANYYNFLATQTLRLLLTILRCSIKL